MPSEELQRVRDDEISQAVDETQRRIVKRFAENMGQYNAVAINSMNAAIANFQTTMTSPSSIEARPNVLGVIAKVAAEEGFTELNKHIAGLAAPYLSALFSLGKAISAEVGRAEATVNLRDVSSWSVQLRAAVNNAFAQHGSTSALLIQVNKLLDGLNTAEERQEVIDVLSFGEALTDPEDPNRPVPSVEAFEVGLYQGWVVSQFTGLGRIDDEIKGFLDIRFEDKDATKVVVVVPLGDRVGDGLNRVAAIAGYPSMMDLRVYKRVCQWSPNAAGGEGWSCGWFDDRNALVNEPNSKAVAKFLRQTDWRKTITAFRT